MSEEQRARTLAERLAEVEARLAVLEAHVASDTPAAAGKPAVKGAGKKKAEESAEEDTA